MSNANHIRSDVMPDLNILEILTTLEEYTIAIGGVVEGIALVTIIVRHRFKGSIRIAAASILDIFAGVAGASHGPGEILQGGGSLGDFGCGVFKALAKRNMKIDIVAGTSIGGVNAAIIAGSK